MQQNISSPNNYVSSSFNYNPNFQSILYLQDQFNYPNSNSRRVNHSQGRNISDYNNTLSLNRSMTNNNPYPTNSSRRSPLQINPDNTLRHSNIPKQQRNETEPWDKTKGPYGARFDEMEAHMKLGQKRYKDDLEYLMSLKDGRHGDMTQKEWEEYNRKLHYMNDVSYFNNIINIFLEICLW